MIRIAEEADAPALLEIYAPFIDRTAVTFDTTVPALSDFVQKINKIKQQAPFLVYEHEGEILGYASADVYRIKQAYRWTRELSVYVREDAKTKKCGTALYTSLIELLRCQNYRVALAGITLPNIPSVNFHERLGFYPVGVFDNVGYKLGKSHRVGWWQLMLQEPGEPAREIISLEAVLATEQGQYALKRGEARVLI
jgi:phosphinothricin acetyltransferase